ncbi:MAG: hypothetical protein FWC28_07430, partial [Proteobacteria bacterium]|nr:hypothetical protein [Pseudomonadota bacterium]
MNTSLKVFKQICFGLALASFWVGVACSGEALLEKQGSHFRSLGTSAALAPWTQLGFRQADVSTLNQRRVFFAHNAVGSDISSALRRVAPGLSIRTGNSASSLNTPGVLEYSIGSDAVPLSKIAAFETQVNNLGSRLDIAFMKLSYIDFEQFVGVSTDNIINAYKAAMDRLEARFPEVVFVHCTTPLYNNHASWHNNQRELFNAWLRATYGGRVFDLATLEATRANGTLALSRDDVSIALADEWARNDALLNTNGADRVAGSLIAFLAEDFSGATAEPELQCRIGDNSCPAGYVCVGIAGNPNGTAGTCVQNSGATGQPWTKLGFDQTDVNTLNQRRVFFAHNTIGNNVASALRRVAPGLSIRTGNSVSLLNTPAILEYWLGFDAVPLSKAAAFETQVNNLGAHLDIALMKLSYIDFEKFVGINTDNIINAYKAAMDRLEARFPGVVFVHCTAPLYNWNASWDNNQRELFNAWLRTTYKGRVFDLAVLEATRVDGTLVIARDGVSIALANEWALGDSQLNTEGANRIAGSLIAFLASDFSGTTTPEPQCRVGDNSCPSGYVCEGISGNQNGAPGTCQQEVEPECYVGNDAVCGGNGYVCVGISGNQNGAPGTCRDTAECRVGNNNTCGGSGYVCVGNGGSTQNGAPGTCQDTAECRVGGNSCPTGYACVGNGGSTQNGAPGTCQDTAECRVGNNNTCGGSGYVCVGN